MQFEIVSKLLEARSRADLSLKKRFCYFLETSRLKTLGLSTLARRK